MKLFFKMFCSSCHARWEVVVTEGSKSLKFSDLKKRLIADYDAIKKFLIMVLAIWKDIKVN